MTGVLNSIIGTFRPSGLTIGQSYEGGYYGGVISTVENGTTATHRLVVAPKSTGETGSVQWISYRFYDPNVTSMIDGPGNTATLDTNPGGYTYAAAEFCADLTIGGYTDWYLPAPYELDILYYNLKPTTVQNSSFGYSSNPYANGPLGYRPGNTLNDPLQTSATDFKSGGSQAFEAANYWSSSRYLLAYYGLYVRVFNFNNGRYYNTGDTVSSRPARAIRRVAI